MLKRNLGKIVGVIVLMALLILIFKNVFNNAYGILYVEQGSVEVNDGFRTFTVSTDESQEGMKVYEGYTIKTNENSYATIVLFDASTIKLAPNTKIKIKKIEKSENNSVEIFQFFGETWSKVEKISGIKSYRVETPYIVALVRGTSFIMSNYEVAVEEGVVELPHDNITLSNGTKAVLDKRANKLLREVMGSEEIKKRFGRYVVRDIKLMRKIREKLLFSNSVINALDEEKKRKLRSMLDDIDFGLMDEKKIFEFFDARIKDRIINTKEFKVISALNKRIRNHIVKYNVSRSEIEE